MGLHQGTLRHYGVVGDVNGVILMADIVLYTSSQDEQGFPIFLTRAMSFGIPIIAADYPVINRYVSSWILLYRQSQEISSNVKTDILRFLFSNSRRVLISGC